jgi:hypothetical protein
VTLALRLPRDTVAALDRYVDELGRQLAGVSVSRNDAMRRLIVAGLAASGHLDDGGAR